jgi:hypothetical protein
MENINVVKSLKRQLVHIVLHEQLENAIAISNNLSANLVDYRFETPRRVFQTKQKHLWIEKRLVGNRMPQATPIIPCEMQIGEAQRHTNSLL